MLIMVIPSSRFNIGALKVGLAAGMWWWRPHSFITEGIEISRGLV